jgi:hypothetical protein
MDVVPTFGSFWPRSLGFAGLLLSVPNAFPQRSAILNRVICTVAKFRAAGLRSTPTGEARIEKNGPKVECQVQEKRACLAIPKELLQPSKCLTSIAQIRVNIRDFGQQVTALVRILR